MARRRIAQFPARLASLRPLAAFVERSCAEASMPREQGLRVNLVLEELFTNTVNHGFKDESDSPVWIAIQAGEDAIDITYEDCAPAFNPFSMAASGARRADPTQSRPGGLGVVLATEIGSGHRYAYAFGRNRVELRVRSVQRCRSPGS